MQNRQCLLNWHWMRGSVPQRKRWEAMWEDEVNPSHLVWQMKPTKWKSGTQVCVGLNRTAQLSALVCFTLLSTDGSAQLTGVNVFFSHVVPFRVKALRDMPIWFEFITVAKFKYITFPLCEEILHFCTFHLQLV